MESFAIYLIKVNVALIVLYAFYKLSFSKDTFFRLRRIMLLLICVTSLIYPLIDFSGWTDEYAIGETITTVYNKLLPEVLVTTAVPVATTEVEGTTWQAGTWLWIIYGLGIGMLLLRNLLEVSKIHHSLACSQRYSLKGVPVYQSEDVGEPCSFFHWIFINPMQYSDKEINEILIHEQTHVREFHSLDIILAQLIILLCWFNPFSWLIRSEIRMNHEYLADKQVVTSGYDKKSYQYHLLGIKHTSLAACNDMNECVFEKMEPGTEEGITPAVRCCARGTLFDNFGRKQFIDVAEGRLSLDDFMAQLSDDDLIHLLGGQPNVGVSNTFGFGNLPDYGVPSIMTADGPAGLRISGECSMNTTAWPCATLLACTWNPALVQQVGQAGAEEVKENNLAVWLTPAVNIHRNPLCGRNFEYYSEDPLIAGKMGAAMVKGIQSQHIAASVKHFAANNKETNRKHSDSRVSERALREIYLKGFEIIVKEAQPWTIMSSYNAINGHRASENRELLEDVLRGEWCFKGMVTTDWWTRAEHYKEIKAGNDVKMGTGFPERVKKAMEMGQLGRPELEHCARRVLELILKID